jgi:23S rRNA pseudouridine2605 synthase
MNLPEKMRLQRMIALSSSLSRRAAEAAISSGDVTVNGEVITQLGTSVDPLRDQVSLKGTPLRITSKRTYIAYFKPRNVMVTKADPEGRPTIWDGLEAWRDKLNSVGRLDFESDGLLLLTDDGHFLNLLTHPRHEIWKVYRARVKGELTSTEIAKLRDGLDLNDGRTLPARVKRVDKGGPNPLIEISIREGRNRQVRRMFDALEHPVIQLRRVAIGPVKLGRLTVGKWRHLKGSEVTALMGIAKG